MSDNTNNTNDDNTPTREPIGTLEFYVSERITELAKANERQAQLTVSHAQLGDLLELAKVDPETTLSRKKGVGLLLEVRTKKGNEIPLVMADTHAIWFSHQRDKKAQQFVKYFAQLGGEASVDLLSASLVGLTTGKSSKKVTAEAMEDCPV